MLLSIFRRLGLFVALILLIVVGGVAAQDNEGEATPEATDEAPTVQEDYTIPAPPDGLDLSQVIAQVGDETITLGDFRTRVRYERVHAYARVHSNVEQAGEQALDLTNPNNQGLISLISLLVDDVNLGQNIYNTMVNELLYTQEAAARDIEVTECEINEAWTFQLGLPPLVECELPEGFEEARQGEIERAEIYAGLGEEELVNIITAQAFVTKVRDAIGDEFEAEPETTVRTRHIRIADEETMTTVLELLEDGGDFDELLVEYTLDESAVPNFGYLGEFQRGQTIPAFEQAIFAEGIEEGDIIGPIEIQGNWHVIEVVSFAVEPTAQARHILLETEEEAEAALDLINDGRDFAELAREYSLDPGSGANGGDLGTFGPGAMVQPFNDAVFAEETQPGDILGPIETEFGWHVIEVVDKSDQVSSVEVRHILQETEEDAQAARDRIDEGEDFGDLAVEISLDPSAAGLGADTLSIATGGQGEGFYGRGEILPEFDAVFEAAVGDYVTVGPITTPDLGYFLMEVLEFGEREPADVSFQQNEFVNEWEADQQMSGRVMTTDVWRGNVPLDPIPSDVFPALAPLDSQFEDARAAYLERRESNLIPNVLRDLEAPEPEAEATEPPAPSDN